MITDLIWIIDAVIVSIAAESSWYAVPISTGKVLVITGYWLWVKERTRAYRDKPSSTQSHTLKLQENTSFQIQRMLFIINIIFQLFIFALNANSWVLKPSVGQSDVFLLRKLAGLFKMQIHSQSFSKMSGQPSPESLTWQPPFGTFAGSNYVPEDNIKVYLNSCIRTKAGVFSLLSWTVN